MYLNESCNILLFFEKRKASYFVTYRLQIYELISSLFSFSQILIDGKEERWEEMRLQITFWKGDNGRQVQCVSAYQSDSVAQWFRKLFKLRQSETQQKGIIR